MAQTRTRQRGEEDFFAGFEKGNEIRAKHQELQFKRRELQVKTAAAAAKLQMDQQKLQTELLKSGINPGSAGNTRVGMFNPFTGEQVPGGVLYDPVAGTAIERNPAKRTAPKQGLSPRDLSDLSYVLQADPAMRPFMEQILKERGIPQNLIDEFAGRVQKPAPAQERTPAGKRQPAQADSQGRKSLESWVVGLRQIAGKAPFERVAQEIVNAQDLTLDEKRNLLVFARKRFRPSGGQ